MSLELRKGMCPARVASAWMQSPRALRDLLMNWASLKRSPVASVLLRRSLPARSTRRSLERHTSPARMEEKRWTA